ncbi:hypothetical protein CR513_54201, partial [Mucuna pruriens]
MLSFNYPSSKKLIRGEKEGESGHCRSMGVEPKGKWARIILEGSRGVLNEQSLRFKASNNQAKYEALLVGIRLVEELGAKILVAKSDSQLVTEQVNNDYQANDP